jgi:gamma-glutamylcyclotransferase (GGCT)/AIG2-like uncharacterized protein YtfP
MSDSAPRKNPPPPQNPSSKISPVVLKMRSNSPSRYFPSRVPHPLTEGPPPIGLYFFYGSLQDPGLLEDILNLKDAPTLYPAIIKGYKCKLWGQYPALMKGDLEDIVKGAAYEVKTVGDAERLANYEGPSYTTISCIVQYNSSEVLTQAEGHAFLFVGNERDLSEGLFDLRCWMERRALKKGRR